MFVAKNRSDEVGSGGDEITGYLIEWSRVEWDLYTATVWDLSIGLVGPSSSSSSPHGNASYVGSFRLGFDNRNLPHAALQGNYITAAIPVNVTAPELEIILESLPNILERLRSMH